MMDKGPIYLQLCTQATRDHSNTGQRKVEIIKYNVGAVQCPDTAGDNPATHKITDRELVVRMQVGLGICVGTREAFNR
jgi:hypothetical protein